MTDTDTTLSYTTLGKGTVKIWEALKIDNSADVYTNSTDLNCREDILATFCERVACVTKLFREEGGGK
jgi:hypothetical protein